MKKESKLPREHRAGAIVVHNGQLLVNWRQHHAHQFYVFPGGETEPGETPEQAVVRELDEETSIAVTVERLLYVVQYTDIGFTRRYYLCTYVSGEPEMRPDAEEQEANARGDNIRRPMWLPLEELSRTTLYPLEIRDRLIGVIPNGFVSGPQTITTTWANRRQ